ncbi:hypothetical protein [Ligilactobacillus equi]|uniref:hypothetical protein n=1 Tax=Ligilactobacillus equi TaxID=137357 RepID=UPI0005597714|nr:hypothetical protein [Ligilactobacillus equi]
MSIIGFFIALICVFCASASITLLIIGIIPANVLSLALAFATLLSTALGIMVFFKGVAKSVSHKATGVHAFKGFTLILLAFAMLFIGIKYGPYLLFWDNIQKVLH